MSVYFEIADCTVHVYSHIGLYTDYEFLKLCFANVEVNNK